MSKQLTHARNVLWHGQAWSVMVVDTFSALLREHYHTNNLLDFILSMFYWRLIQVSSLFCFSSRIQRPTPSPPRGTSPQSVDEIYLSTTPKAKMQNKSFLQHQFHKIFLLNTQYNKFLNFCPNKSWARRKIYCEPCRIRQWYSNNS